jgi:mannose-6-phosphate isomerase
MYPLEGPVRDYAWGSRTAIAELQGRPSPSPGPEAELWLGAHPASPAVLCRDTGPAPLTEVIAEDPAGVLGGPVVSGYGPRLPFLLKVLAAAQPLSLQAHPDLDRARAGFAADEAAGVPPGSPERTYADAWHKPELLVALGAFDALCGFRDPRESAKLLAVLDVAGLAPTVAALGALDREVALREAVHGLLNTPAGQRAELVSAVVAAAAPLAAEHPSYALAGELAARYPGDVGVVVALLLNRVRLTRDQAVWMPAGNLHAYLAGVGIEIMAASDNVLRCGLTPKPVNVPELLRVLRFEVLADPVVPPRTLADGVVTWPAPVGDFALLRATVDGTPVALPAGGPRVLLGTSGSVTCDDGTGHVTVHSGQAAFVPASAGGVTLTGAGEVWQAGVGSA